MLVKRPNPKWPLVVAYGMGVDSTAVLVNFVRHKVVPDLILFADTGGEKETTYAYRDVINPYLRRHRFPEVTEVRYVPTDFKNWPPYYTLEQNCLTNGTLPSISFGFKSCSLKWKAAPQHKFLKTFPPAVRAWGHGGKVVKMIGYDAGPQDLRRRNHTAGMNDKLYRFWYPLIEWGWDRGRCMEEIAAEGLPIPPKSSCFFCCAMKPYEVADLPADKLKRIVAMEARAAPRLRDVEGLWRTAVKGFRGADPRPGSMTEFILENDLLHRKTVERIRRKIPLDIVSNQEAFAQGGEVPGWDEYLEEIGNESYCSC